MKERPIIFNDAMVRAILEGRKTQTRRVIALPKWAEPGTIEPGYSGQADVICKKTGCFAEIDCPSGQPGDRLWVREPLQASDDYGSPIQYVADGEVDYSTNWVWRRLKLPAMLCPRGMSRITLEITGVRVERLQDISRQDAKAEGFLPGLNGLESWAGQLYGNAQLAFEACWRDIYGAESWQSNPWVWVVEFRRVCA